MRVLSLGLDNSILDKDSSLFRRAEKIGRDLEKYFIIVPNKTNKALNIASNIMAIGTSGSKFFALLKIYHRAKKLIKNEKIDIITVQDPYYLAFVGYLLARKYKIALEIQIHGFEKFEGIRKLIAKNIIRKADSVRAVSERLKKKLINQFQVNENKIIVIPIYVDLGSKNYGLRDYNIENKFVFLTVSRFVPVKNIELQLEALRDLVKKNGNIELWLVGDGAEKENYKFQITNYKLDKYVRFFGWVNDRDELDNIYQSADCFLLTSNSEGWGMAVVDAMKYSLPIIMTDVGLAGEVVINNESGLVIPVCDKEALVENMKKIMINEDLREKLGKNARLALNNLPTEEETYKLYKQSWELAVNNANAANKS